MYVDCITLFDQIFVSTPSKVIFIKSTALFPIRAVFIPRFDLG